MSKRSDLAHDYFKEGYNCAQSTFMAFSDVIPMSIEDMRAVSEAFGGGFAKLRGNCGAVSAIGMLAGFMVTKSGDPEADKKAVYKATRDMIDLFIKRNGTLNCGELLKNVKDITADYIPTPRSAEYYRVRPCVKFVTDAVEIAEEYFNLPELK